MPRSPFANAVLVGGPAAAGKTTVARLLARKHGLRWYSTDAHTQHHRAIAVAQGLHEEDDPTPGTFDRGPLISTDLDRLAAARPEAGVVVEGALVTPSFAPLSRSVWLMPSAAEQSRRLIAREGTSEIHHGLLYGHSLITEQLAGTAATIITVDGQTVAETIAAVEDALGPTLDGLAGARTRLDRRQVIRYGNRALAEQLRSSVESGHLDEVGLEVARIFDCECAQVDCVATVPLRPAEAIDEVVQPPGSIRAVPHEA